MTNPAPAHDVSGTLELLRLIVHEVPKAYRGQDAQPQVDLSDEVSVMDPALRADLTARMRQLLASTARPVAEDPDTDSPVPGLAAAYLQAAPADGGLPDDDGFVGLSQDLARHLRASQTGTNSGGLLLVADALLDDQPALLLVKLEHAKGIRGSRTTAAGRTRFDVARIQDLLLTDKSNVYKLCVLQTAPPAEPDGARGSVTGHAADPQTAGRKLADFFLGAFLGCRYVEAPDVLTQRFHQRVTDWINDDPDRDAATRTRYAVALLAEIDSQRRTISVRDFARESLDATDRDGFRASMLDGGLPLARFPKDPSLVTARLGVQFDFASGTYIVTTTTAIDEGVVTVGDDDPDRPGMASVVVRDRIRQVKGRGTPGRRPAPAPSPDRRPPNGQDQG